MFHAERLIACKFFLFVAFIFQLSVITDGFYINFTLI